MSNPSLYRFDFVVTKTTNSMYDIHESVEVDCFEALFSFKSSQQQLPEEEQQQEAENKEGGVTIENNGSSKVVDGVSAALIVFGITTSSCVATTVRELELSSSTNLV